jgi:thiamine biosynthesis lipoprotein
LIQRFVTVVTYIKEIDFSASVEKKRKPRMSLNCKQRVALILTIIPGIVLSVGCELKKETRFTGKTMGTTYRVKIISNYFTKVSHLKKKVKMSLEGIDHSLSTYKKNSEISRFNSIKSTTKPFRATKDFLGVMDMGKKLHKLTQGAWDGTIDPLVNLWGFGRSGIKYEIPAKSEIETRLAQVGFDQIDFLPHQMLKKRNSTVKVDLASIAKGYGVDKVADLLRKNHITDFLVEIGGEVYAKGRRKDGQKWRVGINEPHKEAPVGAVYTIIELEDKGFATSGDYRNFIEINGKRYSHVIDPNTGWPVDNGVVSVSILADTCALADGLATAIMVMGPHTGQALLNHLDSVEGMILTVNSHGSLREYPSKGFKASRPLD